MSVNWPSDIPDNTPISKIAIRIAINSVNAWNDGYVSVEVGKEGEYASYRIEPWTEGVVPQNKWVTYTCPLSDFSNMEFSTYADIRALSGDNGVLVKFLSDSSDPIEVNICYDDIRFYILE